MRKKILLLLIYSGYLLTVSAQEKKNKIYQFHSINSIGIVAGENGASAAIQSVNGFAKGSWFAGIGLGIDYYQYRTIPVFADLRYEFGKKKDRFFVYGNAGMNFKWTEDYFYDEPSIWNSNRTNRFKNGLYYDTGIGITPAFKNGNAFLFSFGISGKTMKEIIAFSDWRTGDPTEQINTYRFNRIIFKAGFKF